MQETHPIGGGQLISMDQSIADNNTRWMDLLQKERRKRRPFNCNLLYYNANLHKRTPSGENSICDTFANNSEASYCSLPGTWSPINPSLVLMTLLICWNVTETHSPDGDRLIDRDLGRKNSRRSGWNTFLEGDPLSYLPLLNYRGHIINIYHILRSPIVLLGGGAL